MNVFSTIEWLLLLDYVSLKKLQFTFPAHISFLCDSKEWLFDIHVAFLKSMLFLIISQNSTTSKAAQK